MPEDFLFELLLLLLQRFDALHELLVMMLLLLSLLLNALSDLSLFGVASLSAQLVRVLAGYLNKSVLLEVVKELDDVCVHVVLRLRKHSLLRIFGLVLLLLYFRRLGLRFGIRLCRGTFSTLSRLPFDGRRFFDVLLLDSLPLLIN